MEFSIRKVIETDAATIIALLNPTIQAGIYTVMDEPFSVSDQIEFIRSIPPRGIYHIALDHNQKAVGIQDVIPISSSIVFKHLGEISTFVALDSQRQGVGQHLSEATFKAAKDQGFLKLRATVRADNLLAFSFYQSQGFEMIGVAKKHAFLHGKYIDEILLEKFIK